MDAEQFLADVEARVLGPPVYTNDQVVERSGMTLDDAEPLWMELGFPPIESDVRFFTQADAEALGILRALLDAELVSAELVAVNARVLGHALARVAAFQAQAFAPAVAELLAPGRARAGAAAPPGVAAVANTDEAGHLVSEVLVPTMERFTSYVWRRHLVAALRRCLDERPTEVVGFCDLVGYTRLTTRLQADELPDVIGRFQQLAGLHLTTHDGRITKLIGDAVMFVVGDPAAAARAAVGLWAAAEADPRLPELRIGLARGPLVELEGDVYGETVNRASRLVELARPGTILADDETAAALLDSDEVDVRALRPRRLKGIGLVRAWSVRPRQHALTG